MKRTLLALTLVSTVALAEPIDLYTTTGQGALRLFNPVSNSVGADVFVSWPTSSASITVAVDGVVCAAIAPSPTTAVGVPMACNDGSSIMFSYDIAMVKKMTGRMWVTHYTLVDGLIERTDATCHLCSP